jgi:putative DNA primase/helicase
MSRTHSAEAPSEERAPNKSADQSDELIVAQSDSADTPDVAGQVGPLPMKWSRAKGLSRTDIGNADRLIDRHGEKIRYVPAWGRWTVWHPSEGRWLRDESGWVAELAKETVNWSFANAEDSDDRKFAYTSASKEKRNSAISTAQSDRRVVVKASDFDAQPWFLSVLNGVVNLKTGKLIEANPDHLLTRQCPVEFDAEAEAPRWDQFLAEVAPDDELRAFLQRAVGYALTGDVREQKLFYLHGGGRNGKSTFIEIIQELLGDHAIQAPEGLLEATKNDKHLAEVARLHGSRLVVASELRKGKQIAEERVKQLTGGDRITARFLYKEFFEFAPTFKIWVASNYKPTVAGTDDGIWRRFALIPFEQKFEGINDDKGLKGKLLAELPGILAWAVRGCAAWQATGLAVPKIVQASTQSHRAESDPFGQFLSERCDLTSQSAWTRSGEITDCQRRWARVNGEPQMSSREVGKRLSSLLGSDAKRQRNGFKGWLGIDLVESTFGRLYDSLARGPQ